MIAVALSVALVGAQPAAEAPVDNEITVIANKLRDWRGRWRLDKGAVACKTTRSTGDKAIDAVGCEAMVACIGPLAPRFAELEALRLGKDELARRANALLAEARVNDCMSARHEAGVAALAAARRSART